MPRRNTLERRSDLLAAAAERRVNAIMRAVTEPAPPFRRKKSEWDQLREYVELKRNGELGGMRERHGGAYTDEQVDRYVAHMERLLAKRAPELYLRQHQEPAELNRHPLRLHEGLADILGIPNEEGAA